MKRVDRRGFIWASALPEYILRSAAAPAHDPLQILPPRSISMNFFSLTGTGLRPSGCCHDVLRPFVQETKMVNLHSFTALPVGLLCREMGCALDQQ